MSHNLPTGAESQYIISIEIILDVGHDASETGNADFK